MRSDIAALLHGIEQHFGERRCVEKPQVHALTGERVHGVRGVADQRGALEYVAIGMRQRERKRRACTDRANRAQAIAERRRQRIAKRVVA